MNIFMYPTKNFKNVLNFFFRFFWKLKKGFEYFLPLLLGQHGNLNNYVNLMKYKRSAAVCMFLLILDPKTGALYTVLVQDTTVQYMYTSTVYVLFVKTTVQCVHKNCNFRLFFNIPSLEYYTWRVDICVYSIYIYVCIAEGNFE